MPCFHQIQITSSHSLARVKKMADKTSTVVLTVNLDCEKCYKKIRKTLCKFHEIERQILDEKQKKVIISGRFNPECLIRRLYCKLGCKIIKGHEIIIPDKPKPNPPPKPAQEPKPTPHPPEPAQEPKPTQLPPEPAKDPKPAPTPKPAEVPKPNPPPPKPTPVKPSDPSKQPIYVGPVYVASICICGRPCGGACTWGERGWCRPFDDEVCRRREGCCSPCRDGRPWDGICRRRDNCCSPCREGRPWDGICRSRDNCCSPCREGRPWDGICRSRDDCCSPCREGRPWDGICRTRDDCCSPCRDGRPWDGICTRSGGQHENSYRFCSEEDSICKAM